MPSVSKFNEVNNCPRCDGGKAKRSERRGYVLVKSCRDTACRVRLNTPGKALSLLKEPTDVLIEFICKTKVYDTLTFKL